MNNLNLTNFSFYTTYVFLMTTATITFIEAMRTNIPEIRNILNLETCVSIVAAFFYSKFVKMIEDKKTNNKITYKEINDLRYLDWSITTPLLLIKVYLKSSPCAQAIPSSSNFPIFLYLEFNIKL